MRLPLLGGAYQARSVLANAQRCINLYPEINPKDSPTPVTHYQRPGFRPLVSPGAPAVCRGVWRASTGQGYCVIGQIFYYIDPAFNLILLGVLRGGRTTNLSFVDNGIDALVVDGSEFGYKLTLATNTWTDYVDPNGLFTGADRVDYMDTFMIWNVPNSNQFASTLSNTTETDPLYFARKTVWPDYTVGVVANKHELIVVGQLKSEVWYNAGNATFPFALLPGAYHEHGCISVYSLASQDTSVYMLGQDLQGARIVFRIKGYECTRISNHALEYQLSKLTYAECQVAIGYCYQQLGHVFYVLSVGDQTWAFDEASSEWSQRGWTDSNGVIHRDRSNCAAFLYGQNVVGDWENGTLYALDSKYYVDTVAGVDYAITLIRGFPHMEQVTGSNGMTFPSDGHQIQYSLFMADIETGGTLDETQVPEVALRCSIDRGRSFVTVDLAPLGKTGEYGVYPQWLALGISRDMIFEVMYTCKGEAALQGAWIKTQLLAT